MNTRKKYELPLHSNHHKINWITYRYYGSKLFFTKEICMRKVLASTVCCNKIDQKNSFFLNFLMLLILRFSFKLFQFFWWVKLGNYLILKSCHFFAVSSYFQISSFLFWREEKFHLLWKRKNSHKKTSIACQADGIIKYALREKTCMYFHLSIFLFSHSRIYMLCKLSMSMTFISKYTTFDCHLTQHHS